MNAKHRAKMVNALDELDEVLISLSSYEANYREVMQLTASVQGMRRKIRQWEEPLESR